MTAGLSLVLLAHIGAQTLDVAGQTGRVDGDSSGQQGLGAFGGVAAKMAFTDLGAHNYPRTSGPEAFGRSLMSLDLVLTLCLLAWHDQTPLRKSNGCEHAAAAGQKPILDYTRKLKSQQSEFWTFSQHPKLNSTGSLKKNR
jgi:hypothetical protein